MVNVENIQKVIQMIEKEENYFNMCYWDSKGIDENIPCTENVCGTPSCIGGWAESIMLRERGLPHGTALSFSNEIDAAQWLGLDKDKAHSLFYPDLGDDLVDDNGDNPGYRATRHQAVAHLRHVINTGEVDWNKFI